MSAPSRKQTSNQQHGGGGGQRGGGQRARNNNPHGGPSGRRGGGNPRNAGGRRYNGNHNYNHNRAFNPNNSSHNNNNNNSAPASSAPANALGPIGAGRRDEEVLIAFMPYLKSDNPRAVQIHEQYQYSNDSKSFLKATREFLASAEATGVSPAINTHIDPPHAMATPSSPAVMRIPHSTIQPPSPASTAPGSILPPLSGSPFAHHPFAGISPSKPSPVIAAPTAYMHAMMGTNNPSSYPNPISSFSNPSIGIPPISSPSANTNLHHLQQQSIPPFMPDASPFDLKPHTAVATSPYPPPTRTTIGPPPVAEFAARGRNDRQQNNIMASLEAQLDQLMAGDDEFQMQPPISRQHPISQPPLNNTQLNLNIASNFDKIHETSNNHNNMPVQHSIFSNFALQDSPTTAAVTQHNLQAPIAPPTSVSTSPHMAKSTPVSTPSRDQRNNARSPRTPSHNTEQATQSNQQSATKTFKREPTQQRRVWTHVEDQPGRISVNDVHSASSVLDVRPRQELSAKWVLPWSYLQDRANELDGRTTSDKGAPQRAISDIPLTKLLPNLRLGLFRRGCAENGAQASIISKSVGLTPHMDARSQTVTGTVPFYSPRTPGHVVFRLYWDDDPVYTLAMGPTLHVRVKEEDYEGTVRFLLSNLKKKVNPTSLSSLHSLALILETSLSNPAHGSSGMPMNGLYERAGSATWGCICEARKVLDACAAEYYKTNQKLAKLSEVVEEMKQEEAKRQEEENMYEEQSDDNNAGGTSLEGENEDSAEGNKESSESEQITLLLREKTRALMSGRASCERKWRDSQLAFASILKAVVTNPSMSLLLRQDMIQKMRLEYELWCPLCEEFVIPGEQTSTDPPTMWYEPLKSFPKTLTSEHVRICQDARASMQLKTLGFVPNTRPLHEILFLPNKSMDPGAVSVFNQLSAAMGHRYQEVFTPSLENRVNQQKEMLRAQVETLVQQCDGFPRGTKVAIFGSSANGFGTPSSDLDMCLQLPQGHKMADKGDSSGSVAMAALAKLMEEKSGMKDIDTGRLTARIPIIKFTCPIVTSSGEESEIECDLSMHNPLAVLNTSFLRTYSDIHPITRVLAFVIKRWAKARDINNPARHTLSSYGYIIMLLHFLTYHQRARTGLVVPVASPEGKQSQKHESPTPLLPNLLWMDHTWPESSPGSPYRELPERPKTPMTHPLEDVSVNTHFYRPKSQNEYQTLLRLFPGQDLSLAILLASFFRYYAFEFDYKRFVVSLHSTAARGLVEREVKAELDGWRHYSAALTIEDPFETFYDVAHVLRGGYYHRIRREFAVAYSKIVDAASGKQSVWNKGDLRGKSGVELLDWICELIATDREKESNSATKQTASVANASS